ncbi:hypothetical protein [Bradyrhizobium sp. STM 3562]|uniref:hypothetical protein n=1 Tax=Bradyrhizobium sp. STM 3562 TaxID=578924 RepID=UPI00388F2764
MDEGVEGRLGMLVLLANLAQYPDSVPINLWNEVKSVPAHDTAERPNPNAFARRMAMARTMVPRSAIRLSTGRHCTSDELRSLCFLAGEINLPRRCALDHQQPESGSGGEIAGPARYRVHPFS